MRRTSLVYAKTHLSELVDSAEHRGKCVIILRHGKPAAALVPVRSLLPSRPRQKTMTDAEVDASVREFIDEFSALEPERSAVEDLRKGRR